MVDYSRILSHPEFKDFIAKSEKTYGLDPRQTVDMNDPLTRMVMTIILTSITQGRNLYAYDQFIKGNALSAGVSPDLFDAEVNPVGLGFENAGVPGSGSAGGGGNGGFVNPASAAISAGGSSVPSMNISSYIQLGTAAGLGGGINLDSIFGAGTTAGISGIFGGGTASIGGIFGGGAAIGPITTIPSMSQNAVIGLINDKVIGVGGTEDMAKVMVANAWGESRLNPNAFNGVGENSGGLFQLNNNGGEGVVFTRYGFTDRFDPNQNIDFTIRRTQEITVPGTGQTLYQYMNDPNRSLADKNAAFVRFYERPADPAKAIAERQAYINGTLNDPNRYSFVPSSSAGRPDSTTPVTETRLADGTVVATPVNSQAASIEAAKSVGFTQVQTLSNGQVVYNDGNGNYFSPAAPNNQGVIGFVANGTTGTVTPIAAGGATITRAGDAAIPERAFTTTGVNTIGPNGELLKVNSNGTITEAWTPIQGSQGSYNYVSYTPEGTIDRQFQATVNYEANPITTNISEAPAQFNLVTSPAVDPASGATLQTSYGSFGPEYPTIGSYGGLGTTEVALSDFSQVSGLGVTNAPQSFASYPLTSSTPLGYTEPTLYQGTIGGSNFGLDYAGAPAAPTSVYGTGAFTTTPSYAAPTSFSTDQTVSVGTPAAQVGSTETDIPVFAQGSGTGIDGSIAGAGAPTDIGTLGVSAGSTPVFQQIQPDATSAGDFGAIGAGAPVGSGLSGLTSSGTTEAAIGSTTPVSSLVSGGAPAAGGASPTAATGAGQAQQAMQKGC